MGPVKKYSSSRYLNRDITDSKGRYNSDLLGLKAFGYDNDLWKPDYINKSLRMQKNTYLINKASGYRGIGQSNRWAD